MWIIVILSYYIFSFLDLKATYHKQGKAKRGIYFTLMAISCAISIANGYLKDLESPGELIKYVVFTVMGK